MKLAISTAPATASSSSSQSRRESWQPSQEANFQTASLGRAGHHSSLRASSGPTRDQGKTGPWVQTSTGPSWQ